MTQRKAFQPYLLTVLLLLIYLGVRLFRIEALPFFIDESILVGWSEQVRVGNPLTFGYDGRYLVPWLLAVFNPVEASSSCGHYPARLPSLLSGDGCMAGTQDGLR
jgi:hypothetical protein